jgi:SAM-dependent methyltransferase
MPAAADRQHPAGAERETPREDQPFTSLEVAVMGLERVARAQAVEQVVLVVGLGPGMATLSLLRMPVLARKLHLGAFNQVHEGWVNTDITPHLLVARVPALPFLLHRAGLIDARRYAAHRDGTFRSLRYLDLSRRFRFPDGYFECAFASHVLEHLHPDVAEACLREVHRVLAPGGIVRVSVPDLDRIVADYDPADPDAFLWGI